MDENLQTRDNQFNWHPCGQDNPLVIKGAYDSYIALSDGKNIIDAISSWWCKSLGHNHPILKKALLDQLDKFEHVIFANTTNETIVQLSQKLTALMPQLNKVFYAGDGSSAVEVALKMSLQTRSFRGETSRNQFIALRNGYHGETIGALSLSDVRLYRKSYSSLLFSALFIEPPYVLGTHDPLWDDASIHWQKIEKLLEPYCNKATAIIIEPIVQGAGGMKIYSQDFLAKLVTWAKAHNIHVIADEIMTGLGRTGKMLACEHAKIHPDFVCLSKGLTSGWLPFSAVLTTDEIYETRKGFLHSHTYSGNALGASIALATLDTIMQDNLCNRATHLEKMMLQYMQEIAQKTGLLHNIRGIGAIVAADLKPNSQKRLGYQIYQEAVELGALLRPLGNTIYWLPPLIISEKTLTDLRDITLQAICAVTA